MPNFAPKVVVQTQKFDIAHEVALLHAQDTRVGAICTFVGTVRERQGSSAQPSDTEVVHALELEHYPGMTEKSIEAIVLQAQQRFPIYAACVIHRVGRLLPLDPIVLVAITAAHRGDSFQACEYVMDYLKTQAPFWKKEHTTNGPRWVDARVSDDAALLRWETAAGLPG